MSWHTMGWASVWEEKSSGLDIGKGLYTSPSVGVLIYIFDAGVYIMRCFEDDLKQS